MFPSFSDTTNFLASYITSRYPVTFSMPPSADIFYTPYHSLFFFIPSSAAIFYTCGKKGGDEEEKGMIWVAGTVLFNPTSSSGLPNDSIITSSDKVAVFPYFSNTTTFLASSVTSPSPDTVPWNIWQPYLIPEERREDNKNQRIIWGAGTGVFNLNYFSGLPTDSIITSPDKATVFPSFYNTETFITSSVLPPPPWHILLGLLGIRI